MRSHYFSHETGSEGTESDLPHTKRAGAATEALRNALAVLGLGMCQKPYLDVVAEPVAVTLERVAAVRSHWFSPQRADYQSPSSS